jgi:hypothetical protein
MQIKSWGGLVTNASPFALPPGSAVEQCNLTADVPGQLTSRGGMYPVAFADEAKEVRDIFPYENNGRTYLLALLPNGQLVSLESPSYADQRPDPVEPTADCSPGGVSTTYTYYFCDGDDYQPPPEPPPVEDDEYVLVLDGGRAGTLSWPAYANAQSLCAGAGKLAAADGGYASITTYPLVIKVTQLCTTP